MVIAVKRGLSYLSTNVRDRQKKQTISIHKLNFGFQRRVPPSICGNLAYSSKFFLDEKGGGGFPTHGPPPWIRLGVIYFIPPMNYIGLISARLSG
jgi:hypothetical protein